MIFFEQLKRILPLRRQTVPLFPLNTVLCPGGVLPLKIFEARYMDMAKTCLKDDGVFGVCLIREGQEVGGPALPETVGCTARIIDWDMKQLGLLQVRSVGEDRFRIVGSRDNGKGLLIGDVEMIGTDEEMAVPVEFQGCAELVRKVIEKVGDDAFAKPYRYEDASWVGFRLTEFLPIKLAAKQKLMELSDPMARLEVLAQFLAQKGLIP